LDNSIVVLIFFPSQEYLAHYNTEMHFLSKEKGGGRCESAGKNWRGVVNERVIGKKMEYWNNGIMEEG
jgi:hypothetical protein